VVVVAAGPRFLWSMRAGDDVRAGRRERGTLSIQSWKRTSSLNLFTSSSKSLILVSFSTSVIDAAEWDDVRAATRDC